MIAHNNNGLRYYTFESFPANRVEHGLYTCLLYTSDAADDLLCVDLGGRRTIKKKNKKKKKKIQHQS